MTVSDEEIQKEYNKNVVFFIIGLIALPIGIILYIVLPSGSTAAFISVVSVIGLSVMLMLMGLIRMIQCKKNPEWVRNMLAKRKK